MLRDVYAWRRVLLVLFLLCSTVYAQSSALDLENGHHHSPEHCCTLCHIGPLPFLHGVASAYVPPVLSVVWVAAAAQLDLACQVLLSNDSSRAPPFSS
jgi:hypothetical protein